MRRSFFVFCFLLVPVLFLGCNKKEIGQLIAGKHAQSYVFIQRMNDQDITKRPTNEEMTIFINAAGKDYESLDIYFNNWKPDSVNIKR